jgi:hypothetical protein
MIKPVPVYALYGHFCIFLPRVSDVGTTYNVQGDKTKTKTRERERREGNKLQDNDKDKTRQEALPLVTRSALMAAFRFTTTYTTRQKKQDTDN